MSDVTCTEVICALRADISNAVRKLALLNSGRAPPLPSVTTTHTTVQTRSGGFHPPPPRHDDEAGAHSQAGGSHTARLRQAPMPRQHGC